MKYKYRIRRFLFLALLVIASAYFGSKSFELMWIGIGGLVVGYLVSWEDNQYVSKGEFR